MGKKGLTDHLHTEGPGFETFLGALAFGAHVLRQRRSESLRRGEPDRSDRAGETAVLGRSDAVRDGQRGCGRDGAGRAGAPRRHGWDLRRPSWPGLPARGGWVPGRGGTARTSRPREGLGGGRRVEVASWRPGPGGQSRGHGRGGCWLTVAGPGRGAARGGAR